MASKILFGEMTIKDILVQSFKLLFSRQWWQFLLIYLIVFFPLLIWELALLFIGGPQTIKEFPHGGISIIIVLTGALVSPALLVLLILQPLATAAILKIILNNHSGESVTIGSILRFAIGKLPRLACAVLLACLAIIGGIILGIIPGIFLMIFFIFVSQVVVMEDLGGIKALGRSKSLTQGYRWRVVILWIWLFVIGSILIPISVQIIKAVGTLPFSLHHSGAVPINLFEGMASILINFSIWTVLFGAFSTIAMSLLYLDIRKKKEESVGLVEVKTSQSAIWSLICGIAGFLCLPIIPAIVLGIIALVNINKSKGLLKGTGMAVTGLVLGGLWIIAIPFIAIVAAIAIPGFLGGSMSAHEATAITSLKTLCSAEAKWKQQDIDGNGIQDYWTYDVSCFNRMYDPHIARKVKFIDISFYRADANKAEDDVFGTFPAIEPWSDGTIQCHMPKSGYYFLAMKLDENGKPYNQNEVGENKIKATNSTHFAFVAYPAEYGKTGKNVFIINERGNVYRTDPGSDKAKIVFQWPAKSPDGAPGPGRGKWQLIHNISIQIRKE